MSKTQTTQQIKMRNLQQIIQIFLTSYIIIEKLSLAVQFFYVFYFFQRAHYWLFVVTINLMLINRLGVIKKNNKNIPLIRIVTFTEDFYYYRKNAQQFKSLAKKSMMDDKTIYFYEFLQESSASSLLYSKLAIFFINALSVRDGWILVIQNTLDIIILLSLSQNFYISTLDKYYEFSRVFQAHSNVQYNGKEIVRQYLLSTLNYVFFMLTIKQNFKLEWFFYFYLLNLTQIIVSCKNELEDRLLLFNKNPLIEKFVFHFDVDGQIFIKDFESVGSVVLTKTKTFSIAQKLILILYYSLLLKDCPKVTYAQWVILIFGILAILIQLIRFIKHSRQQIQQQQLQGIYEIDYVTDLDKFNLSFNEFSVIQMGRKQISKIFIYLQLSPENEYDIIDSLFNKFKGAEIISKQFSRKYIAQKENLVNIRLDVIYDSSLIKKQLLSFQENQQKQRIFLQINSYHHNLIKFNEMFNKYQQVDAQVYLLETNQKKKIIENEYQKAFEKLIFELNQVVLQQIAYLKHISHLQTYNPNIIYYDFFDTN